jgi:hypothetical protein
MCKRERPNQTAAVSGGGAMGREGPGCQELAAKQTRGKMRSRASGREKNEKVSEAAAAPRRHPALVPPCAQADRVHPGHGSAASPRGRRESPLQEAPRVHVTGLSGCRGSAWIPCSRLGWVVFLTLAWGSACVQLRAANIAREAENVTTRRERLDNGAWFHGLS